MASRKNAPGGIARAAGTGSGPGALGGLAFAYKFSGYAMEQARPWFLTGLGQFKVDGKGKLTGTHRSSILPIHGQDSELSIGYYELQGSIDVGNDGTGEASILFTKVKGEGRDIQGSFFVLVPGNSPDRLWLISSGQKVVGGSDDGQLAPELVDLEAVLVV